MSNTKKKRVFKPLAHWTSEFCHDTGFFADLIELFEFDRWADFPSCAQLNQLLAPNTQTLSGFDLQFISQDQDFDFAGRAYESVIYQTGQVPTRINSWHDTFGGLIWCLFPQTKALLNQLHQNDIAQFGDLTRTKTRNAITLLDECGVIAACCDPQFKSQLRQHQWKWAFIEQRERWGQSIKPFIIGHANYEMLTQPYVGLTGKVMFVDVQPSFFGLPLKQQYQYLDTSLAEKIKTEDWLKDNSKLSPLPLLGVPGWYPGNGSFDFYDDQQYFRAKRSTT